MKVIVPLGPNENLNENLKSEYVYTISSDNISLQYNENSLREIGKLLYLSDNKNLLVNQKYIGFIQNRRFFTIFIKGQQFLDFDKVFSQVDIILPSPSILNWSMLSDFINNHFLINLYKKIKNRQLDNQDIDYINYINEFAQHDILSCFNEIQQKYFNDIDIQNLPRPSYHNMFITKHELFFEYCDFVKQKVNNFKNTGLFQKTIKYSKYSDYDKKLIPWFCERLPNIFSNNKKLKIGYLPVAMLDTKTNKWF